MDGTTLTALAEPNRRRIVELLRTGERSVAELTDALGIPQPSTSKHLRALRDAGLVAVRPDAQHRRYRLRLQPLLELDAWLEPYRAMWARNLDALEQHLDEMEE